MRTLIVEDEINACEYLQGLVKKLRPSYEIIAHLDSVQETINWLNHNQQPDLIFLDIQLSDGISFEIFNHVQILSPIIFTTAYDQFALQAFKVNSIDYLLKPIGEEELNASLQKLENQSQKLSSTNAIEDIVKQFSSGKKNRCLVKKGNHFEYINTDDISYINSDDSITFLHTKSGHRHMYTKPLQVLMAELDTEIFFQINRKQIINIHAIDKVHPYLNQRLKVDLSISCDDEFIVARNKMSQFKAWIDS